jgi:hypothetical protein
MSKCLTFCILIVTLSFFVGSLAMADGKDQQRDRKRDGSCDPEVIATDVVPDLASDQDRQRDRKQDGSCDPEAVPVNVAATIFTA